MSAKSGSSGRLSVARRAQAKPRVCHRVSSSIGLVLVHTDYGSPHLRVRRFADPACNIVLAKETDPWFVRIRVTKPTSGQIEFDGYDLTSLGARGARRFRRDQLGYLFQNYALIEEATVRENLAVAVRAGRRRGSVARELMDQALQRVTRRSSVSPSDRAAGRPLRPAKPSATSLSWALSARCFHTRLEGTRRLLRGRVERSVRRAEDVAQRVERSESRTGDHCDQPAAKLPLPAVGGECVRGVDGPSPFIARAVSGLHHSAWARSWPSLRVEGLLEYEQGAASGLGLRLRGEGVARSVEQAVPVVEWRP